MQFVDKIRHRRGQESSAYGCGNAVHLNVVGLMSIHHRQQQSGKILPSSTFSELVNHYNELLLSVCHGAIDIYQFHAPVPAVL